jgi:hypothetical protein
MGRTLPSITQTFLTEQESLARFRRALRREDQIALDDLLAASRRHLAAAAYASHLLPFEIMLLAMLVEEHKELMHLRDQVEDLLAAAEAGTGARDEAPPNLLPDSPGDLEKSSPEGEA